MTQTAPYGSWKSPLDAELVASGSVGLQQLRSNGEDIYWIEGRPKEGGRKVIVRWAPGGGVSDVTPPPFNARTRVHEYGGGDYLVHGGIIYFSNFADQRLYSHPLEKDPVPLTAPGPFRYADAIIAPLQRLLIGVREDHSNSGEPVNSIVGVGLEDGIVLTLVSGSDFYSSPRLSPDGSKLAWLSWKHPNMPWDGTELWVADLDRSGSLKGAIIVAGGETESIFQPEWSPDGNLCFVSDRTGWWNLYRLSNDKVEPLCPMEAEFGKPQWVFGQSTYGFASEHRIVCAFVEKGESQLATLDLPTGNLERVPLPFTSIAEVHARPGKALLLVGAATEPASIVRLRLDTREFQVLRRASELKIDPGYLSSAEKIEFPTAGEETAHGFFYAPKNRDYAATSENEKPPLLVMSHGGPTSSTSTSLRLGIQFWTSRGIAVLDVDYRGSSSYGRAYRDALKGKWGIADVEDCIYGALYLVVQGKADGNRLAITGGSAGGYTTLCALTFRDVFKAGASHYGISDLETLAKDTHKFESRYLDGLIGPYPQRRDIYVQRSPIHFIERLACPMIIFQGLEDTIVPPSQAERMFEAVKQKGLPVAYVAFEGEQHGFRKAQNIKRVLEAELYFYSKVFGFELADPVEPVKIENLEG